MDSPDPAGPPEDFEAVASILYDRASHGSGLRGPGPFAQVPRLEWGLVADLAASLRRRKPDRGEVIRSLEDLAAGRQFIVSSIRSLLSGLAERLRRGDVIEPLPSVTPKATARRKQPQAARARATPRPRREDEPRSLPAIDQAVLLKAHVPSRDELPKLVDAEGPAAGAKSSGGQFVMDDAHLYLDRDQLQARGWTRTLQERFLPTPDRWATVAHWKNYTGKATYFVEKVIAAEQLVDFKAAFAESVTRRKLPQERVDAMMSERARVDAEYRDWLRQVGPEDVRLMVAIEEAAAELDHARARGYRTPHK